MECERKEGECGKGEASGEEITAPLNYFFFVKAASTSGRRPAESGDKATLCPSRSLQTLTGALRHW